MLINVSPLNQSLIHNNYTFDQFMLAPHYARHCESCSYRNKSMSEPININL